MAEMGEGAEEWASGSHAWKGIIASFSPNPTIRSTSVKISAGL